MKKAQYVKLKKSTVVLMRGKLDGEGDCERRSLYFKKLLIRTKRQWMNWFARRVDCRKFQVWTNLPDLHACKLTNLAILQTPEKVRICREAVLCKYVASHWQIWSLRLVSLACKLKANIKFASGLPGVQTYDANLKFAMPLSRVQT